MQDRGVLHESSESTNAKSPHMPSLCHVLVVEWWTISVLNREELEIIELIWFHKY